MTSNQNSRHRALGLVILRQRERGFARQVALKKREFRFMTTERAQWRRQAERKGQMTGR
jgi:hypothetical protein